MQGQYMENITYHPIQSTYYHLTIIFFECDIAQGVIFKSKRLGIIHNSTIDVDPGYRYIEMFRGGVQWYMMESKDFTSSINYKLKSKNGKLVSFIGQAITLRLPINEI